MAFGTDTGVGVHGTNLEELALMAQCGMSLEGALAAATSVAAELVAPDLRLGRVAEDHVADLVLLDRQLTGVSDLTDLQDAVAGVYQAGRQVV